MQVLLLGGLYGMVAGLVGVWNAGVGESSWLECLRFVAGFTLGVAGVFSVVWLGERLFGLRLTLPLLGVAVADVILAPIFLVMLIFADENGTPLIELIGPDRRFRFTEIVLVMGAIVGAAIGAIVERSRIRPTGGKPPKVKKPFVSGQTDDLF